ncbi:Protein of unknown function [Cotesia congregata]|uniref:Uncharacterized protein n=1 Tax=Cotesia congregata TaxID=51543 RepID=A0A8J2MYM4_COTCN|nr:Protein of unknown function [Cotesia congregata]
MGKDKKRSRERDENDNYGIWVDSDKENETVNPQVENPALKEQKSVSDSDKLVDELAQMQAEDGTQVVADTESTKTTEFKKLDDEVELLLGDDPGAKKKEQVGLHKSLVLRWSSWLTDGLPKEVKDKVLEKYSRKGNISLEAPELNEEISATLNETGVKRDQLFTLEQNLAGSALSTLGQGITMIIRDEEEPLDRLELLEKLADAGKLMAQLHYQVSSARRAFISPILTKSIKNLLQATKPGSLLFGEKLTEKIKTAKFMEKIGKEIKASPLPSSSSNNKKVSNPAPRRTLNWRVPYARQGNSYQGPKQYQTKFPSSQHSSKSTYSNASKSTSKTQPPTDAGKKK